MYIYPRVTEIIKKTKSKESLEKIEFWRIKAKKLGDEERALNRGTKGHELINEYLKNGRCEVTEDFKKVMPFLDFHRKNIAISERHVISHKLKYEGTTDIIMILNGKPTILDWTFTSRAKKKEWLSDKFVQCAAYAIAYEEERGVEINQLAVGNISYKLNIFIDHASYFKEQWIKRLKQFYEIYELSQSTKPKQDL